MTQLIDRLAEQHIQRAMDRGELDNLPGQGKPLILDDDIHVPETLRAGYRILKNAGYLPPEMQQRQEALKLCGLINSFYEKGDQIQAQESLKKLRDMELMLRIRGMDTSFLQSRLRQRDV